MVYKAISNLASQNLSSHLSDHSPPFLPLSSHTAVSLSFALTKSNPALGIVLVSGSGIPLSSSICPKAHRVTLFLSGLTVASFSRSSLITFVMSHLQPQSQLFLFVLYSYLAPPRPDLEDCFRFEDGQKCWWELGSSFLKQLLPNAKKNKVIEDTFSKPPLFSHGGSSRIWWSPQPPHGVRCSLG